MADSSASQSAISMESDVPFTTRLFTAPQHESEAESSSATASEQDACFDQTSDNISLFPVSFRTGQYKEKIKPVDQDSLGAFLEHEFSLQRLDVIYSKLWRVGFRRAPKSLTVQLLQGRRIVLAETLDMHLVWESGKIYIKPLPRYLLEPAIWKRHFSKPGQTGLGAAAARSTLLANSKASGGDAAGAREIREAALGLLYSYACLIADRADFELALQHGLIPKVADEPSWSGWRVLATEVLSSQIRGEMHRRFQHGELRLDRLNWIYVFKDFPKCELYFDPWSNYSEFVLGNMASIAAVTVYMVVVLTAMQVGLATNKLKENASFHSASYGFAVFSILAPLIAMLLILAALLVILVPNWKTARRVAANTAGEVASSPSPVGGSLGGQDVVKASLPVGATVTARCVV